MKIKILLILSVLKTPKSMIKQDVKKKKKTKLNSNGQLYIQLEQHEPLTPLAIFSNVKTQNETNG